MTACYIARIYGVRSAMPDVQGAPALPAGGRGPAGHGEVSGRGGAGAPADAGDHARWSSRCRSTRRSSISREPSGCTHSSRPGPWPLLAGQIEAEIGVTVSIGLSYNKFLAKVASDLDKPRGFAVIGAGRGRSRFLAAKPVRLIWGVGPALAERLAQDGVATIGQLQGESRARSGPAAMAPSAIASPRFARGEDDRTVEPDAPLKSVSAETTFDSDLSDAGALADTLWPLCERVAARLRQCATSPPIPWS